MVTIPKESRSSTESLVSQWLTAFGNKPWTTARVAHKEHCDYLCTDDKGGIHIYLKWSAAWSRLKGSKRSIAELLCIDGAFYAVEPSNAEVVGTYPNIGPVSVYAHLTTVTIF